MKHSIEIIVVSLLLITPFAIANQAGQEEQNAPQQYAQLMLARAPDEFKSLLALRSLPTEFVLVNGNSITVMAALGNYKVRLDDVDSINRLKDFLLANDIGQEGVEQVIAALQLGKDSASDCKGDKQRCQVKVDDVLSVIIDAPSQRVRLLLAKNLYSREAGELQYYPAVNNNPALINNINLYSSKFSGNVTSSINDRVILGLPYGHIKSKIQGYTNDNTSSVDVDNLEYNLDIDGYRFMAGRSREFNTKNTTNLLNFSSQQQEGVYLLSSRNLLRGKVNTYQRVYFYMPQAGAVEAYRDGQLLFSQPVEAGQQYISYDQLPAGTYQLELKLKSGDNVVSEQMASISNNPSVTLPTGKMDFTTGISRIINNDESLPIFEGDVAFRPFDNWQMASGVMLSDQGQLLSAGVSWTLSDDIRVAGAVGLFSDSARYAQINLSWANVSLGYQVLNGTGAQENTNSNPTTTNNDHSLSAMLLGKNSDYQQVSLSASYPLGAASAYASIFYYDSDTQNYNYSYDASKYDLTMLNNSFQTLNANAGISMPFFWNSNLGLNLGVSESVNAPGTGDKSSVRDFTLGFNWSLPLGERTQAVTSMQISRNGSDSAYATVRQQFQPLDNVSASLEAGARYSGNQTEATASGMMNFKNDAFSASASGTLNERTDNNVFLSLDSSQVISSEGSFFTSDKSDSYLLVRNSGQLEAQDDGTKQAGRLVIGNGQQFNSSKDYYATANPMLTPIDRYQYYSVKLQSDNGLSHNRGDQDTRGFAFPGTVLSMETRFEKEYQLIGAFYLPSGQPVGDLACEGEACVQIDKLDEGLFKIRLSGDGGYRLISGSYMCQDDRLVNTSAELTRLSRVDCKPSPRKEGPALMASTQ